MINKKMKELRKKGIGGSDAGSIMGYNKYKDINKLYLEKIGQWDEEMSEEQQDRCDLGNFLEEYLAQKFTEKTGKKVVIDETHYKSEEYPFIQANIDRKVVGENAILECKTADTFLKKEWKDGEIPGNYIWQCLHYMYVLNVDRVYIVAQVGMCGSPIINQIDRDKHTESLIKDLIKKEREFWDCVTKKNPPIPMVIEEEKKEVIEINLQDQFKQWDDLQAFKKSIQEKEEKLKESIKNELNGHIEAVCGKRKVTYKTQVRNTFNTTKFKKENEQLYKKYLEKKESKVLRIN